MITGTVLNSQPHRTSFGMEYLVKFDDNPEARAASGCEGGALTHERFNIGDRVTLEYRSTSSWGLWFITGRVGLML